MNAIDQFLNRTTMYRLLVYYLAGLLIIAVALCFAGVLPFSGWALVGTSLFLIGIGWIANQIFARVWNVVTNIESVYITALIASLIIAPRISISSLVFMGWVIILAMASKYMLTLRHKHIFNPIAFAVVLTAFTLNQSANWWVGTSPMLLFVVLGGVLVVRKLRRADMVATFLAVALVTIVGFSALKGGDFIATAQRAIFDTPLLFFAFVMLTEPLTTPPTKTLQIMYGGLVGILFAPQMHLGGIYTTPELALLVGNVFSFLVSPKIRTTLSLQKIESLGPDIRDFVFQSSEKLNFRAGQYMEWTLPVENPDNRGNRRYLTIASSPTEKEVRVGVKFYPKPSRFKTALLGLRPGSAIIAGQLSGSFTLPKNPAQKLVFIAGGIGVTPFRSMLKYLIDTHQRRDIVVLYSNKTADEIVYQDILTQAEPLGVKTFYTLTDTAQIPANWTGGKGMLTQEMLTTVIPDYKERMFYLSGPHGMVVAFEQLLHQMGVGGAQIKTDYFPGYA